MLWKDMLFSELGFLFRVQTFQQILFPAIGKIQSTEKQKAKPKTLHLGVLRKLWDSGPTETPESHLSVLSPGTTDPRLARMASASNDIQQSLPGPEECLGSRSGLADSWKIISQGQELE